MKVRVGMSNRRGWWIVDWVNVESEEFRLAHKGEWHGGLAMKRRSKRVVVLVDAISNVLQVSGQVDDG